MSSPEIVKRAAFEKRAKNVTRLLSRVGADLSGATPRDMKFMLRRGFKGFTPEQVKTLMSRGMLPSTEKVMSGASRGTTNMLEHPLGRASSKPSAWSSPAVVNLQQGKLDPGVRYGMSTGTREVFVPEAYRFPTSGGVYEQLAAQGIARHEAREFVRGNAGYAKSRPGISKATKRNMGSSHEQGVLYDERLFKSQTANRLGLGLKWEDMPVFGNNTRYFRGLRELAIGNRPLSFDFRVNRNYQRYLDTVERYRRAGKQLPSDPQALARTLGIRVSDVADMKLVRQLDPNFRVL